MEQLCPLYSVIRREHGDPLIEELNPGDALEPEGRGTGKTPAGCCFSIQFSTVHSLGEEESRSQAASLIPSEDRGGEP